MAAPAAKDPKLFLHPWEATECYKIGARLVMMNNTGTKRLGKAATFLFATAAAGICSGCAGGLRKHLDKRVDDISLQLPKKLNPDSQAGRTYLAWEGVAEIIRLCSDADAAQKDLQANQLQFSVQFYGQVIADELERPRTDNIDPDAAKSIEMVKNKLADLRKIGFKADMEGATLGISAALGGDHSSATPSDDVNDIDNIKGIFQLQKAFNAITRQTNTQLKTTQTILSARYHTPFPEIPFATKAHPESPGYCANVP